MMMKDGQPRMKLMLLCVLVILAARHGQAFLQSFRSPAGSKRTMGTVVPTVPVLDSSRFQHHSINNPNSQELSGSTELGALPGQSRWADHARSFQTNWNHFRGTLWTRIQHKARRALVAAALFISITFSFLNPALARSSGRSGGSFGSSRPPPVMRSMPRSSGPVRSYYRSSPRIIIHRGPHMHIHSGARTLTAGDAAVATYAAPVRRIRMSDVVFVAGVTSLVAMNVMDKLDKGGGGNGFESALGPGISVVSLTAAINVPDRDSPDSVLNRISRLALSANTSSRKGVQDLISETALELLRQKDSIVSVDSQYSHFRRPVEAEREYNVLSIGGRSKFDEETGTFRETMALL